MRCVIQNKNTKEYVASTISDSSDIPWKNGEVKLLTKNLDKARVYNNAGNARVSIGIPTETRTGIPLNEEHDCLFPPPFTYVLPEDYEIVPVKIVLV